MSGRGSQRKERGNAILQFYRWVFGLGYERNIGGPERTVRYMLGALFVLAGIGLIAFPLLSNPVTNVVVGIVLIVGGVYVIYEAQVQYCPLNHTFDRSTYAND